MVRKITLNGMTDTSKSKGFCPELVHYASTVAIKSSPIDWTAH